MAAIAPPQSRTAPQAQDTRWWRAPPRALKLLGPRGELAAALLFLSCLSAAALLACFYSGHTLDYGDAEAHLNIARRVFDSRTPGWRQIGTFWLPLPHLLILPFAQSDRLWRSGLAGAIPSALCFVFSGLMLFAAARRLLGGASAAAAALLTFALNPNLLYLQSIPMTEPMFFACVCALFYFAVRYCDTHAWRDVAAAGLCSCLASLARYEGWFLIPFASAYFLLAGGRARWKIALVFGAIASSGPLLWLFHNWWFWGDALEFYRGQYSAHSTYRRALASGAAPYQGDHSVRLAWLYYRSAAELCLGWPLILLGAAGTLCIFFRRELRALLLLLPAPLFYVWTLYSGGIPIFVPQLWPHAAYNTRYGLAALPFLALAVGALIARAPARLQRSAAALAVLAVMAPWLGSAGPSASICWTEAQASSIARRASTADAAAFLRAHYQPGDGILMSFGDLTGVLREAGIPLREALIQDNGGYWQAEIAGQTARIPEAWALTAAGDRVAEAGAGFHCLDTVHERGAPTVQIYRHN